MSRARILAGIRATLDGATRSAVRRQSVADRLARSATHPRPQRVDDADLVRQFMDYQRALGVDVIEVDGLPEIPAAIAGYLYAQGLPARLRRGSDPWFDRLSWKTAPDLSVDLGPARDGDTAGLSLAIAGVAETGTLALASGFGNPATLAYLPDTHLVVLRADAIVGGYEEACAKVLAENEGALPHTFNLITGASRTGDIGGKIVMGAHGPRRLAVILVAREQ